MDLKDLEERLNGIERRASEKIHRSSLGVEARKDEPRRQYQRAPYGPRSTGLKRVVRPGQTSGLESDLDRERRNRFKQNEAQDIAGMNDWTPESEAQSCKYLSDSKFGLTNIDLQVKFYDYGYRAPEPNDVRFEQLNVLKAKLEKYGHLYDYDLDTPVDANWIRAKESYKATTYADYRKEREVIANSTASDPLGLGSDYPPNADVDEKTWSNHYSQVANRSNAFSSDEPNDAKPKLMSSQEIESKAEIRKRQIEDERKKKKAERERQRLAYEEDKRKRLEAIELDKKAKMRRDRLNLNRTLLNRKVIEETRQLPKELKEFDLIGAILMPQVKASMSKEKEIFEDEQLSTSSGTTYHCHICDKTSNSAAENQAHLRSTEHIMRKQQYDKDNPTENSKSFSLIDEYYSKQKIETPEPITPSKAKVEKKENGVKPDKKASTEENDLRPDTPQSFCGGGISPAPSFDSDNEVSPQKKKKTQTIVTLATPSPPPAIKEEPKPPPSPTTGMARVAHIIRAGQPLTLQQLYDMPSFTIQNESEAQLAKELLRKIDHKMYKYVLQIAKTDMKEVLDDLREKGLLRDEK